MSKEATQAQPLNFEDTTFSLPTDSAQEAALNFNPVEQSSPMLNFDEPSGAALPAPQDGLVQALQQAATAALSTTNASSSEELATILDGFARVLRGELVIASDRSAEIAQMKELLVEAQETIINLLNDRVADRARIARLEAENRVLPDLQSQATRAMGLAMRSEDVQSDITNLRAEVERLRVAYVRSEQKSNWLSRLFGAK